MTAAAAVFGTYELLEQILLHVPLRTALLAQRVNKGFQDVVARSQDIRQALFLQPVDGGQLRYRYRHGFDYSSWASCWEYEGSGSWEYEASGRQVTPILKPFLETWKSKQAVRVPLSGLLDVCFTMEEDWQTLGVYPRWPCDTLRQVYTPDTLLVSQPPSCASDMVGNPDPGVGRYAMTAYFSETSNYQGDKASFRSQSTQSGGSLAHLLSALLAENGEIAAYQHIYLRGLSDMQNSAQTVDEITAFGMLRLIRNAQAGICLRTTEADLGRNPILMVGQMGNGKSAIVNPLMTLCPPGPSGARYFHEHTTPTRRRRTNPMLLSHTLPAHEGNLITTFEAIKHRIRELEVEESASNDMRQRRELRLRVHHLK